MWLLKESVEDKLEQFVRGGDVIEGLETEASKEEDNQRIYPKNSWLSIILMTLCLMCDFVIGKVICYTEERYNSSK